MQRVLRLVHRRNMFREMIQPEGVGIFFLWGAQEQESGYRYWHAKKQEIYEETPGGFFHQGSDGPILGRRSFLEMICE